jgi:hypothetical protein
MNINRVKRRPAQESGELPVPLVMEIGVKQDDLNVAKFGKLG